MKRENKDVKNQRANMIYRILKAKDDIVSTKELCELTNLSQGQIRNAVEYARDRAVLEPDKFIRFYFLSSKKGYRLPSQDPDKRVDEIAACFATLHSWSRTLYRRITPLERFLNQNGVQTQNLYEKDDNYDEHLSEYIGDTFGMVKDDDDPQGWFLETTI